MSEEREEQKPFEYLELQAICNLCVAQALYIFSTLSKYKDELEATKDIEKKIKETIDIRWNSPDKNEDSKK